MQNVRAGAVCISILLSLAPQQANAFSAYKCTIKDAYEVIRGTLEPHRLGNRYYVGGEFVVDHATGKMSGKISSLGWIGRNEVLDFGSNEQSYISLYISPGPYINVRLLTIQEYREGSVKDFVFTTNGEEVFTGTCTKLN
jgi:hypothetical protein